MTACGSCGRDFVAMTPMQLLCRLCWFEKQGDFDMALAEQAWERGYELGYRRGEAEMLEGSVGALPLRDLIALCHPDRHPPERSELANTVTAWLNELRSL